MTDRISEIRTLRESAIPENGWHEPVSGCAAYCLVMRDIPYLLDRLAEAEDKNKSMQAELIQLAQESVKRDLALAKLEAEVKAAMDTQRWVPVTEALPESELVLALVNGKPQENILLNGAFVLASYIKFEGWVISEFPEWEEPEVTHWMELPEPPEEGAK